MSAPIEDREPFVVGADLRLVPVVELEPGAFRTRTLEAPARSGLEDPTGWDRYWRESLTDAGLGHLDPIHPGSWLVPIERLVEPRVLTRILEVHQARVGDEAERPAGLDEVEPLSGGFVLCDPERELVTAGCCATLGDDWRGTVEAATSEWSVLWIGHPWASVRREGARLWLRLEAEHGPPPEPSLLSIDPGALRRAIEAAAVEQRALAERLRPVVEAWLAAAPGSTTLTAAALAPFLAGVSTRPG